MTPTDPLTPEQLRERSQMGADRAKAIAAVLATQEASPIEVLTSAAMAVGLFMEAAGFDKDHLGPVFMAMQISAELTLSNARLLKDAPVPGHG